MAVDDSRWQEMLHHPQFSVFGFGLSLSCQHAGMFGCERLLDDPCKVKMPKPLPG